MSELRVDNVAKADGTGSVATEYVTGGSAKAWASYRESVSTLEESLNVTSVTDNGTGLAQFNFTSSMATTTYASFGAWASRGFLRTDPSLNRTVSAVEIRSENTAGTASDAVNKLMHTAGDLA